MNRQLLLLIRPDDVHDVDMATFHVLVVVGKMGRGAI